MEVLKVFVIFLIFAVAILKTRAEINESEPKIRLIRCTDFRNLANFSDPDEVKIVQDTIMSSIWNIPKPRISDLGKQFKDVLFDMIKCKVPFWRRYALAVSEWIWAYIPSLSKNPALCSYASLINATVEFSKTKNCDVILKAIDKSTTAFTEAGFFLTANGIRNAGCRPNGIVPETTVGKRCYKDGFVYALDEIWRSIGWQYPCKLRRIVAKLYRSHDLIDKIMALLSTAVLSDFLSVLENQYPPEPLYKLFVMLTPGYVPQSCCRAFIAEAKELSNRIQIENVNVFKLSKMLTNCTIV